MALLRRAYGAGPGHLAATLAGLLIAAYGIARIGQHGSWPRVAVYFVLAILAHDLFLLPLYTLLYAATWRVGRIGADRSRRVPVLRHLVVPTVISAVLFIAWFPLILRLPRFSGTLTADVSVYLSRWLIITAALFLASGALYAIRALRARGLPAQEAPPADGLAPGPPA